MLLLFGPWTVFWERNYFVEVTPLAPLLLNHAFRGAVSGVGIVCLASALAELWALRPSRLRAASAGDPPRLDGPGAAGAAGITAPRD